jgi:hypothetical protein
MYRIYQNDQKTPFVPITCNHWCDSIWIAAHTREEKYHVNRTEQGSRPPIYDGGIDRSPCGLADEVLAPNYVNRMTGADLAAFK